MLVTEWSLNRKIILKLGFTIRLGNFGFEFGLSFRLAFRLALGLAFGLAILNYGL
jgi:hypothetical protein